MASSCPCDVENSLSKVPNKCVSEEYWRRKLPPGFRYVLDTVARNVMRESPDDVYLYSGILLEELQLKHRRELSLLPDWPYFNKFLQRMDPTRVPPRPQEARTTPTAPPSVRTCCKCGRTIVSEMRPAPGLGVFKDTPEEYEGRRLVCCGNCRILALEFRKDPFGHRDTRREIPEKEPFLISCRSLAMLYDY